MHDQNQGIEQEIKREKASEVSRRDSIRPPPMGGVEIVVTFAMAIAFIVIVLGLITIIYNYVL